MKIFICHASEDKYIAEPIQLTLVGAGHDVFYDENSLPPGGDFYIRIHKAIKQSDLFIFLISKSSLTPGKYTLSELDFARKQWPSPVGRLLAVNIESIPTSDIPHYLSSTTILSPKGNVAAEVGVAVEAISKLIAKNLRMRILKTVSIFGLVVFALYAYYSYCNYSQHESSAQPDDNYYKANPLIRFTPIEHLSTRLKNINFSQKKPTISLRLVSTQWDIDHTFSVSLEMKIGQLSEQIATQLSLLQHAVVETPISKGQCHSEVDLKMLFNGTILSPNQSLAMAQVRDGTLIQPQVFLLYICNAGVEG